MFRNMKIYTKLVCGFGIVLVLLMVVIIIYSSAINTTTTNFNNLMNQEIKIAEYAENIKALMLHCRQNEKDFLLQKDKKYFNEFDIPT